MAKGYFGRRKSEWTVAKNAVEKGLQYAYAHRKEKKRNFRALWIARINAAVRAEGLSYSKFMGAIHTEGIEISRKTMADLALHHPEAFSALVDKVRASVKGGSKKGTGPKFTVFTPEINISEPKPKREYQKPTAVIADEISISPILEPIATTEPDNLRKIEGIGPAIEGLLNAAGIYTFAQLAATEVEAIEAILEEAGSRFSTHKPGTWPRQAALAADGKWDELKAWQDVLDGGKEE